MDLFCDSILNDIELKKNFNYSFDNTLTNGELIKFFDKFKSVYSEKDIDYVSLSTGWSRIYNNGKYTGYFDTFIFNFHCSDGLDNYTECRIEFSQKLISPNEKYSGIRNNLGYYYSERLGKLATAIEYLFNDYNFLIIPVSSNIVAVNKRYVKFRYLTKNKSSFSLLDKDMKDLSIVVNRKSSGWISQSDNYYYRLFMLMNEKKYKNICAETKNAVENIINNNNAQNLAAFSITFGAKQIKCDMFICSNGVKEDVRNYTSDVFIDVIAAFNKNPAVFKHGTSYINTKYLMSAFKCVKSDNTYKLVPSRSSDSSWYCFHMNTNDFNRLTDLARNYNDPDELAAWQLLGEFK